MADGQDHPTAWGLAPQTAHLVDIQVGHEQPDFFRRARREPHQLDQVAAVAHIRAHGLGADPWVVGWQAEHVPEVPVGPPALRRPGEVRQLREPADHSRRGTRRQHDQQPRRGAIAEHRGPLDDAGTGARSPVRCLEPPLGRPRGFRRRLRALARRHWRVVVANPRAKRRRGAPPWNPQADGVDGAPPRPSEREEHHFVEGASTPARRPASLRSLRAGGFSVPTSVSESSPRMNASTRSRPTSSGIWRGGLFMK